jgi:hypothetical protein
MIKKEKYSYRMRTISMTAANSYLLVKNQPLERVLATNQALCNLAQTSILDFVLDFVLF